MEERVHNINGIVQAYFNKNPNIESILAKDLMPKFIEAGIYDKDHRNGLPLRKDLRELDAKGELDRIPFLLAVRKNVNTNWYFIPSNADLDKIRKELTQTVQKRSNNSKAKTRTKNNESDESYILDLCDEVLGLKGLRQHRFDFLLGDLHSDGKSRTRLPCDIYYPELNLVIEYNEKQHTEQVKHFDKPDKLTVSGVHRGEQRRRYDERRRKVLPEHGIKVVDFSYFDFEHTGSRRLKRNRLDDQRKLSEILREVGVSI